MASDLPQLIEMTNGRNVTINGVSQEIQLNDVAFVEREQDWRFSLLSVITNPNVAYILMLIGIYGLLLEFYNPGVVCRAYLGYLLIVSDVLFANAACELCRSCVNTARDCSDDC